MLAHAEGRGNHAGLSVWQGTLRLSAAFAAVESCVRELREGKIICARPGTETRAAYEPGERLVLAEAGADGDLVTALGAAAAQHGGAGLGLHAGKEPVLLYAGAAVGLKGALRHGLKNSYSDWIRRITSIPHEAKI